jgi:hypothetical protein
MSNLSEIFKNSGIRNLAALIFLLLSFFLNFLYSLYSKVDLFNTNITGEKNKKEKRTVRFISANIRSFYVINCFLQTFFNTIIPISDFAEKIAESL